MRIVVFAGVFDPAHLGHVSIVEKALLRHDSAQAIVVAEKVPQHKQGSAPYQHRHRMLELSFSDHAKVNAVESPLSEHKITPFFTWLMNRYPDAAFSWVVGSDVLPLMSSWPDIENLKNLRVDEIIVGDRGDRQDIDNIHGVPVIYLPEITNHKFTSSKKVRSREISTKDALHPLVRVYIKKYQLY